MTAAFRSVAGLAGANANGATMTKPTGTVENDILVAQIQVFLGEGKFPSSFSFGSGWTVFEAKQEKPTTNPCVSVLAIKRAGGSEPASYSVTWTGGAGFRVGGIETVKEGRTTGEPFDATPEAKVTTVATTKPKGKVKTVTANDLLVFIAHNDNGASYTPPTSFTERLDNETEMADAEKAGAGEAEIEGTCSESRQQVVWIVAIPPLAIAPTVTTLAASAVSTTSATLNGEINPNFGATNYWWEYGTTEAFGSKTGEESAGEGGAAVSKSKGIAALAASTKYFFRMVGQNATGTTNGTILNFTTEAEAPPAARAAQFPPPPQITVAAIAQGGQGRGFDLTDEINGLQWSSVNPGGDEICSFTINRSWFAGNPELAKGNLLRVMGGLDVLWQGRIEEIDRATGDVESLSVTAYGLGNRLGDVTFQEIYIDRDLGKWGEPSAQRKVDTMLANFAGRPYVYTMEMTTVPPGTLLGGGVVTTLSSSIAETTAHGEMWYFGGGIDIGVFLFDYQVLSPDGSDANFFDTASLASNDRGTGGNDTSTVYQQETKLEQKIEATVAGRKYIDVESTYLANLGNTTYKNQRGFLNPTVLGRHGLSPQGSWPLLGLTVNQIIGHVLTKATGIAARRISSFAYVVPQFVIDTPTTPKDAIPQANEYADADYGTWGPNSPLDSSTNGYFDYTAKEPSVQHWFANREDFEADLNFHTETSSLYDNVDVSYADEAGINRVERFSITSPDLKEAGLSPRVFPLNAGTTTKAGAQLLGELFLSLFAGFAPARGSGSVTGGIQHYRRGQLPPYYLRADGSNIRIPDILPAETTFSLDSTPDRRTTFPIKRVTIDASGDIPRATVEFDQVNDSMAKLLAQEAAQAALIG